MLIHFIHRGDAYLPELAAYKCFLKGLGHEATIHASADGVPSGAAVLWWMCGVVPRGAVLAHAEARHVHEYASASVPPAAWLKDRLKQWQQPRPHYRIFQSAWVKDRMGFDDGVPYDYRDMGVCDDILGTSRQLPPPQFDFVYLGDMGRLAGFRHLLEGIESTGRTLLLIGALPDGLRHWLDGRTFATLVGRVPHAEVPALLASARYGLNVMPDRAPYNQQTSTKLLEYCAAGLPVVSTDYPWVRRFEQATSARFIYLPDRATATDYAQRLGPALDRQARAIPAMQRFTWEHQLRGMRVWDYLGLKR